MSHLLTCTKQENPTFLNNVSSSLRSRKNPPAQTSGNAELQRDCRNRKEGAVHTGREIN